MTSYSYEERDKAYALMRQTDDLAELIGRIGKGEAAHSPDLQAFLANLTGATDLERQHRAIGALADRVRAEHHRRLVAAARDDFSCYVEVINPAEPCTSQLHRFLSEKLMQTALVPDSRMAVSMPPGHAKDLCVRTPVLMADGSSKRLGDIEVGERVITHTGQPREVLEVHDQGVRETLLIKTWCGREVRAHPEHPFLTPGGWVQAKDLAKGDVLAQQREFSIGNSSGRSLAEFALAGYMMAAGMVKGKVYSRLTTIDDRFRTYDEAIADDVIELARTVGAHGRVRKGSTYNEPCLTVTFSESFRYWLEANGLWGQKRHTMRVPSWVFQGGLTEIGAFLGAVFSMDGHLRPIRNRHTGSLRSMVLRLRNRALIKDLRRLFMRLGARAVYNATLHANYNYEPTEFFTLTFPWAEDIALLRRALRIVGSMRGYWDAPIPVKTFFDGRYGEDRIVSIAKAEPTETRCLTVEEDHSFLADGLVVHNSTYCSRLFPSWVIGRTERKKWLQAGHTQRFAENEFGKKTRDEVIRSPGFSQVFPDLVLKSDAISELILSNGSSYVVKGVGQGISGYRSHFNNIDDPYPTEKDAQSITVRNNVWHWFTNDFRTRRLPGSGELIIVTRWHIDDIVGRLEDLVEAGEIEPWEIINLPAFSDGPEVDQLGREKGAALWPELFNERFLLNMKGPMEEARWHALYLGKPVMAKGNILQRDWIKYYEHAPLPIKKATLEQKAISQFLGGDPRNSRPGGSDSEIDAGGPSKFAAGPQNSAQNPIFRIRTVVSVDSAETVSARADNTAIQVWVLGSDYRHYLMDVEAGKMDFPTLITRIEKKALEWGADIILMETKGAGNQYVQQRSGHAPCPIIGFSPGRVEKTLRFDGTMHMWQAGDVLLPAKAPWLLDYVDELLKFPGGKRDDNVDATSQYLQWSRVDGGHRRGTKKMGGA